MTGCHCSGDGVMSAKAPDLNSAWASDTAGSVPVGEGVERAISPGLTSNPDCDMVGRWRSDQQRRSALGRDQRDGLPRIRSGQDGQDISKTGQIQRSRNGVYGRRIATVQLKFAYDAQTMVGRWSRG
jgi:hypothetical protein